MEDIYTALDKMHRFHYITEISRYIYLPKVLQPPDFKQDTSDTHHNSRHNSNNNNNNYGNHNNNTRYNGNNNTRYNNDNPMSNQPPQVQTLHRRYMDRTPLYKNCEFACFLVECTGIAPKKK